VLCAARGRLVQPTGLELPLLNPQLRRDLGIVATHVRDEPLRVLARDEHLDRIAEREVGLESVVDDALGPADVAEPIHVLVLDDFADELRAELTQPSEGLVDVVHGEHDP
jgi:hypothetical protein